MLKLKISAELVKKLREKTGVSIMECRKALEEAKGNLDKAADYLRKIGKEQTNKKSDRETSEGVVASYVHVNKKIGAMVELFCETDFVAKNSEFQELAHDLAMQIAAANPKYLSFESVDNEEKSSYAEFVKKEFESVNKPAEIMEKMVSGKVKSHFEKISLLNQPFIKDPNITIGELINEKIAKIGENIQVGKFERFEI